ncbi:hypothetical protein DFS33DRAFT_859352 [Desarmillaria ectypa]|nr:hypothetical protein DFS33DRAFT_859352 [Desarmillaria ectypa]
MQAMELVLCMPFTSCPERSTCFQSSSRTYHCHLRFRHQLRATHFFVHQRESRRMPISSLDAPHPVICNAKFSADLAPRIRNHESLRLDGSFTSSPVAINYGSPRFDTIPAVLFSFFLFFFFPFFLFSSESSISNTADSVLIIMLVDAPAR